MRQCNIVTFRSKLATIAIRQGQVAASANATGITAIQITFDGFFSSSTGTPGELIGNNGYAVSYTADPGILSRISGPNGITFTIYAAGGDLELQTPFGNYRTEFTTASTLYNPEAFDLTNYPLAAFSGSFDELISSSGIRYMGQGSLDGEQGALPFTDNTGSFLFTGRAVLTPEPGTVALEIMGMAMVMLRCLFMRTHADRRTAD